MGYRGRVFTDAWPLCIGTSYWYSARDRADADDLCARAELPGHAGGRCRRDSFVGGKVVGEEKGLSGQAFRVSETAWSR